MMNANIVILWKIFVTLTVTIQFVGLDFSSVESDVDTLSNSKLIQVLKLS